MGRELAVLWVGRRQRGAWEPLQGLYRERIEGFAPVSERVVKPAAGSGRARLAAEADRLRAALPERAWTVALDRRGRARGSKELASWLGDLRDRWPHPVTFVLGSDLGLDENFVGECRERLSLGPMTLPHELARLVLYEQLYRALSINAGIKYHRDPL